MIKLIKLIKPQILMENEEKWNALYQAYLNKDESVSKSVETKYSHKEIKTTLVLETHGKCAYCESKIQHISYGDIEHILPKSKVPEKIFEWSNLTLACTICNNKKRDYYELDNQIIDPYTDEPSEHHYYCGPLFVDITDKGFVTRKKLDLNRTELIEERTRYLTSLTSFTKHIINSDDEMLKKVMLEDLESKAGNDEPYSNMVKDFIEQFKFKHNLSELQSEEVS